jgi:hypothetical protein
LQLTTLHTERISNNKTINGIYWISLGLAHLTNKINNKAVTAAATERVTDSIVGKSSKEYKSGRWQGLS